MTRILNLLRHAEGCALALLVLQVGGFAVAFWKWLSFGPVAVGLIAGGLALQRYIASGYGITAKASPARAAQMRGQTAVVTGANTGIGFETAKSLLQRQVRVVIACRSKARGEDALRRLAAAVPGTVAGQHVRLALVDMESQASVREFATQGLPKCLGVASLADVTIDMLVNNAGLFSPEHTLTKDGVEKVIAVNHVSGFLLTELLIDAVKRGNSGRGGRVICVGSIAHFKTDLDRSQRPRSVADALERSATFVKAPYYDLSKLCNLMHAAYLAQEHGIAAFSVHPGGVLTEVFRNVPVIETVLFTLNKWLLKTPVEGAQTTLHCLYGDVTGQPLSSVQHGSALLVPGGYYADCRLAEKCRNPATRHPDELRHFVAWSKKAASL